MKLIKTACWSLGYLALMWVAASPLAAATVKPPPGFTALFNGQDLAGWRGGETFDHRQLLAMLANERDA